MIASLWLVLMLVGGFMVVLDNDYANCRAYDNRYCPALNFTAAQTRIRRSHFGEANMSATRVRHSPVAL